MAVRGRAARRDRRAFRREAAREAAASGTAASCSARNPVFAGDRLSRQLFRDRFRELPGLARLGLSRPRASSTALAWARCAAPTARSCSARWAGTPRMPGASIFRRARPISTISAAAASISPAASRARSRRKPGLTPADYRAGAALGLRGHRAPSIAMIRILRCRHAGRSAARADRGQSRPAAAAGTCRASIWCAAGPISRAAMPRFVTAFLESSCKF